MCPLIFFVTMLHITSSSIFDIRPDEYIKKYLYGVFTAKSDLMGPTVTPSLLSDKGHLKKVTQEPRNATTEMDEYENYLTKEEYEKRKLKMDVTFILEKKNKTLLDFDKDEIAVETRRFEEIRDLPANVNYRREIYFDPTEAKKFARQKNKIVRLMEQFIYETRYKLPYVQLLQTKYRHTPRYRLGFCFAILQHLKQEQRVLYTTMKRYMDRFQALFIHIKMYEKIVRLDVDIKDVIVYIKKLNWERMEIEDPVYLDQVKDIQQ
ncbi:unnamed protein product [Colias eurytheme]|nr:unnamed protein product [Colias eurytheme]